MKKWYEGLKWGETLRRYYRWKEQKEQQEMELAAERDILRLRREELEREEIVRHEQVSL